MPCHLLPAQKAGELKRGKVGQNGKTAVWDMGPLGPQKYQILGSQK